MKWKIIGISIFITVISAISYLLAVSIDTNYLVSPLVYFVLNFLTLLLISLYFSLFKSQKGHHLQTFFYALSINILSLSFYLPFLFCKFFGKSNSVYEYLLFGELNLSIFFLYLGFKKKNNAFFLSSSLLFLNFLSLIFTFSYFKLIILLVLISIALFSLINQKKDITSVICSISMLIILITCNVLFYVTNTLVETNLFNCVIISIGIFIYLLINATSKAKVNKYIYFILLVFLIYSSSLNLLSEIQRVTKNPGLINDYFSFYILLSGLTIYIGNVSLALKTNHYQIKIERLAVFIIFLLVSIWSITLNNTEINLTTTSFNTANDMINKANSSNKKFEKTEGTKKLSTTAYYDSKAQMFKFKSEVTWLETPKERFVDLIGVNFSNELLIISDGDKKLDFTVKFSYLECISNGVKNITNQKEIIVDSSSISQYYYSSGSLAVKLRLPEDRFYDYSILPFEKYHFYEYKDFKITLEANLVTNKANLIRCAFSPFYLHQNRQGELGWENINVNSVSYSTPVWANNPKYDVPLLSYISVDK